MLVAGKADLLPHFQEVMRQHFLEAAFFQIAGPNEFTVFHTYEQRLYFEYYGGIDTIGWEEEELNFIRGYFPDEHYVYSLSYSGIEFIKLSLLLMANSPAYLIDNGCGTLLPGHECALKIEQTPGWNWLYD